MSCSGAGLILPMMEDAQRFLSRGMIYCLYALEQGRANFYAKDQKVNILDSMDPLVSVINAHVHCESTKILTDNK